jgi:hypothetical protein
MMTAAEREHDQCIFSDALRHFAPQRRAYADKGDWIRNILCVLRSCQIEAFAEVQHRLSDEVYWKLLRHITVHSHNHYAYLHLYRYLMKAPRAGAHEHFMQPSAFRFWQILSNKLLLFRGHGSNNKEGLYYSTNPVTSFCYMLQHNQGTISNFWAAKTDCFLIGTGRNGNIKKDEEIKHQDQVLYVPGLGAVQSVMNGTDETAREKLRQWWHNSPPPGFITRGDKS